MIQSDSLFKQPNCGINESTGKEEQILLPHNLFINLLDANLQSWILEATKKDSDIKDAVDLINKSRPSNLKNNISDWKVEEVGARQTIFYKGKNYIPNDQGLQQDIIRMFHDHKTAGHPGELKTYNLVKQYYCVIGNTIPHLILLCLYLIVLMHWWHQCLLLFTPSYIQPRVWI